MQIFAVTKIQTIGTGVTTAKECMITEDAYGSSEPRLSSIIEEQPHTLAILEEGAIVEATEGLLGWGPGEPATSD